ncbi:MAG TPA: MATE family efflux transporter [Rhodospirillales bacterium]|nr:MATE family efflux transporter [Rhodospirillales bacterium]
MTASDLNSGSMNRDVWRLAAPIILSNVSVPLLGAVDTAVVGHLPGPQNIGAVAIGALIFSFIYWGFGFLRMGTTGFCAQALGARDNDEVRSVLARAILVAIAIGLAVVVVQWPIRAFAFGLIEASQQVEILAGDYYRIRIWGAPAVLINYAMVGWFIGIRNTRAALIMQLVMNGLNIILDIWFVMGLELGVAGVAWASLISETAAIGVGLMLTRKNLVAIGGHWIKERIFNGERLARMIAVNRDIFVRTMCLQAAFALFTAQGAKMGDAILAANAILLNFQSIMAYALDGFAHAVEALAGGFLGAKNRLGFRQSVKTSSLWAIVFAIFFSLIYALFGGLLVDMMTDIDDIRALAREFMPWMILTPLLSVWSFQLDGIFIGATRTADMRNAMVFSLIIFVGALVLLVPGFGNHGLWAAFTILMIARAITLGLYYPALERSVEP